MAVRPAGRAAFVAILLLVSGAAALAHEAAWQRLWTLYAGAGVASAAAVVAGTLLGLGLGSAAGGRLADRSGRPGRVFSAAEILGGLLAYGMPALVAARIGDPAPAGARRLLEVALACALPCACLGASLPAAVRALVPARGRAGPLLAGLYAANTLGAVLGILGATGFLVEAVGVTGTVRVASAAQVLVGVAALALPVGARSIARPLPPRPAASPLPAAALVAAAALSGAAALAVEIAWVRRLTPALGTTSYAFGTVLGVYLLGVALGAALLGPHGARPAGRRPALVLALAAVPVALLAPALHPVARWAGDALAEALGEGTATAATLLRIRAIAAAAILVPTTMVGAAALPWLLHAADPEPEGSGRATGRVLAANTIGSAVAAVLAGAWAIPALGTAGTLRAAAALYLASAALVVGAARLRGTLAVLAGALAVLSAVPLPDAAARDAVGATFDPAFTDPEAAPATFFAEGRVSTVVVRSREGRPELWVDGKVVASASPTDRLHLSLLGHLPMCLHPDPRRVAVVGLGTGITSSSCALHAPSRLDVFELEANVRPAAEAFRPVGGGLPASARFHVVDGRLGLLASDEPYDVITTDPIHPAAAGSAALYTREHYELLARRLAAGGVVCQWCPLYELSTDDLRMVLRTFSSVFEPFVFVAGPDLVIVGVLERGRRFDPAAVERRIAGPVREALAGFGLASAGRLLGLLVAGPDRVRNFSGKGPLDTDDRPLLEFSSARSQYTGSSVENLRLLSVGATPVASILVGSGAPTAAFAEDADRSKRLRRVLADWMRGDASGWRAAFDALVVLEAESSDAFARTVRDECQALLARQSAAEGDAEGAAEDARAVLARDGVEPRARLEAAQALHDAGFVDEARAAARALLPLLPRSARVRSLAGP